MAEEATFRTAGRLADVLGALAATGAQGMRFSDVAAATGYGKATTHRLLAALTEIGFAYQDPISRQYRLGAKLALLGEQAMEHSLQRRAGDVLRRLARRTEDTVFLSIREGASALCIGREIGAFPIHTLTLNVGDRRPLGVGSGSLALLSALPDAHIERIIARNRDWLAQYPGFDADALHEMVADTRQRGYAFNNGRLIEGMSAIAITVPERDRQPGTALAVAAINSRMRGRRRQELLQILREEAEAFATAQDLGPDPASETRNNSVRMADE